MPGLFVHHRRDGEPAAIVGARDVDVKEPLPHVGLEIRQQTVDRDAGVIHQQIDRPRLLEHGGDGLRIAHVGADGKPAGLRRDCLGSRLRLYVVDVYRPAVARQRQCGSLADAARSAGHECDFFHAMILPKTNICQNAASMLLYTCFIEISIHPVDPEEKI